jgi:hypothetical protein
MSVLGIVELIAAERISGMAAGLKLHPMCAFWALVDDAVFRVVIQTLTSTGIQPWAGNVRLR